MTSVLEKILKKRQSTTRYDGHGKKLSQEDCGPEASMGYIARLLLFKKKKTREGGGWSRARNTLEAECLPKFTRPYVQF